MAGSQPDHCGAPANGRGGLGFLYVELNGLRWHIRTLGDGPPLLLLHGFTEGMAAWENLLPALAVQHRVVAVDLIGHGRTAAPADPERYRMENVIDDLRLLVDQLGWERFRLLGYSLGGRVALHLALAMPHRIEALVLESTSPGIADAKLREQRRQSDEDLAHTIERNGVEAFVADWERLPLFASEAMLPHEERQRLQAARRQNSAIGLANVLRGLGQGTVPFVGGRLKDLNVPTLLLVGQQDAKYVAIANQMAATMSQAEVVEIAGAGHAVHREQPDVFLHHVMAFLQSPKQSIDGKQG